MGCENLLRKNEMKKDELALCKCGQTMTSDDVNEGAGHD